MMNVKLLETVADIAYFFGTQGYFSGDSRADVQEIIFLAKEFESQQHDWEKEDYIMSIDDYSTKKLKELRALHEMKE